METLVPYYIKELKNYKINIINKEATSSDIMSKYDCVILATGSKPAVPAIQGLDKFYWADILLEENLPSGKKVLIIGDGLIVVSTSMTSYNPLENELKGKVPVYVIGDAKKVGNVQHAICDGYETAKII